MSTEASNYQRYRCSLCNTTYFTPGEALNCCGISHFTAMEVLQNIDGLEENPFPEFEDMTNGQSTID